MVAAAIYVNFFSHHWLPDVRWLLAGLLLAVTAGTSARYTVRGVRRRMPLAFSFKDTTLGVYVTSSFRRGFAVSWAVTQVHLPYQRGSLSVFDLEEICAVSWSRWQRSSVATSCPRNRSSTARAPVKFWLLV